MDTVYVLPAVSPVNTAGLVAAAIFLLRFFSPFALRVTCAPLGAVMLNPLTTLASIPMTRATGATCTGVGCGGGVSGEDNPPLGPLRFPLRALRGV